MWPKKNKKIQHNYYNWEAASGVFIIIFDKVRKNFDDYFIPIQYVMF